LVEGKGYSGGAGLVNDLRVVVPGTLEDLRDSRDDRDDRDDRYPPAADAARPALVSSAVPVVAVVPATELADRSTSA